jgi:ATP-binding cassette subfamily B protein
VKSLRRLLPYYHRYRTPFWWGLGLLASARVFDALIPQLLKVAIDDLAARRGTFLLTAGAGIAACTLARFAFIWVGRRAIRRVGLAVAYDLRNRLYDHLQRQGPLFFARHRTGDLMARAINDIGLIRQMVALGTRTVFVLACSALVGFAFMLRESVELTLLLGLPLPGIFLTGLFMSRRVHAQSLRVQEGFSSLSERTQENLAGIRTIQALVQEEQELRRFQETNRRFVRRYLDLIRTNSLLAAYMPGWSSLATLVVIVAGGSRVLSGELSLGSFTAFLWYLNLVLWPVREAGAMINLFQRGSAGVDRLFELLDHPPEIADVPASAAPGGLQGGIELRGLRYRYPGAARDVLAGIDLRIPPGETLAILGRVGAGKSTLLRLLVRMLDPPPGTLLLDGRDVRELPLALVRDEVALMPQEPFLFSESVRENLAYDDPDRAHDEVESAAWAADLAETLDRFPDGLETPVGERGVMLSGGQKQRVTLARALVRDTPILLLDDPFSSVDSSTEERILERIVRLRAGRTTVVVSHRVSAVRGADRVVVLDGGRIVEAGAPAELLARGGVYARLARVQGQRAGLERRVAGDAPLADAGDAA